MEDKRPKRQSAGKGKAGGKTPARSSKPAAKRKFEGADKGSRAKGSRTSRTSEKAAGDKSPFWTPFAKPDRVKPAPSHSDDSEPRKRFSKNKGEDNASNVERPAPRRASGVKRFDKQPNPDRPNRDRASRRTDAPANEKREQQNQGLWWESQPTSPERPSRQPRERGDRPPSEEERPNTRKFSRNAQSGGFSERPSRGRREQRPYDEERPNTRNRDDANASERPSSRRFSKDSQPTERPVNRRFSKDETPSDRPKRFSRPSYSEGVKPPTKRTTKPKPPKMDEPMRLNKFLSHCGIAARRQSAVYVKQGLVTVNGAVEPNPSYPVQAGDEVRYKGQVVRLEERKVYILMNKPKDIITSANDEKGRRTVLDLIGDKVPERIFPVGRLDRNTSGLLLLTNDGDLAEKLAHPSHKVQKVYHVTLNRAFHRNDFEKVQKGLQLDDGPATVDSLHYVEERKDELEISLHIGKNRIVRRIFEHLGYEVVKLDRTYYAGLTKKNVGRGHFRHLTEQEVIMLKHFK